MSSQHCKIKTTSYQLYICRFLVQSDCLKQVMAIETARWDYMYSAVVKSDHDCLIEVKIMLIKGSDFRDSYN